MQVPQIILQGDETIEDYLIKHNYKLVKRD